MCTQVRVGQQQKGRQSIYLARICAGWHHSGSLSNTRTHRLLHDESDIDKRRYGGRYVPRISTSDHLQ